MQKYNSDKKCGSSTQYLDYKPTTTFDQQSAAYSNFKIECNNGISAQQTRHIESALKDAVRFK